MTKTLQQTCVALKTWVNGPMGAYEIRRRCECKSTKEAEQCSEERDGDGYEHCEPCTYSLYLISLVCIATLIHEQSFRA
jgi:hypothetical protein